MWNRKSKISDLEFRISELKSDNDNLRAEIQRIEDGRVRASDLFYEMRKQYERLLPRMDVESKLAIRDFHLGDQTLRLLNHASAEARASGFETVEPEHVLLALCSLPMMAEAIINTANEIQKERKD